MTDIGFATLSTISTENQAEESLGLIDAKQDEFYTLLNEFWASLKRIGLTQKTINDDLEDYYWRNDTFVCRLQPFNRVNGLCNQGSFLLSSIQNSAFEEIREHSLRTMTVALNLLSEIKEVDKNQILYGIFEKAIYNDWYEFAHSLFPNMRSKTKEEQEILQKFKNDHSELIDI